MIRKGLPLLSPVFNNDTVDIELENNVTIKINLCNSDKLETGGSLWHASHALCKYIYDSRERYHNKVILELGSGVGLCGIYLACISSAKAIILTDINEEQSAVINNNISLNKQLLSSSSCEIMVAPLLFGSSANDLYSSISKSYDMSIVDVITSYKVDLIIGSDIGYDTSLHSLIATTVDSFRCSRNNFSCGKGKEVFAVLCEVITVYYDKFID